MVKQLNNQEGNYVVPSKINCVQQKKLFMLRYKSFSTILLKLRNIEISL